MSKQNVLMLDQAMEIVKKYDNNTVSPVKDNTEIINKVKEFTKQFSVTDEVNEKIIKMLTPKKVSSSLVAITDESDLFFLKAIFSKLAINSTSANFDENQFDIKDIKSIIRNMKNANKVVNPLKILRNEMIEKNEEVTAEKLAKKGNVSIEEATKFLERVARGVKMGNSQKK